MLNYKIKEKNNAIMMNKECKFVLMLMLSNH